jgi:hypothetical protein
MVTHLISIKEKIMECLNAQELTELVGTDTEVKFHSKYPTFPAHKDLRFFIKEVVSISVLLDEFKVGFCSTGGVYVCAKNIDADGYGIDSKLPVLILADSSSQTPSLSFNQETLKKENSKPSATSCAKCGGPLKVPFPNIKYCPVCE